ncbi:MAG: hypothetical protein ACI9S8_001902 [Chlamydiales bacterium]|jgi:hypothetical protein
MTSEIRSFTGRASDIMNRVAFSKPDETDYTNKKFPEQMKKTHSQGRKIIRGIGRFFLSAAITGVVAPIGAVYHLSASALSYRKASSQMGEEKEKSLKNAKAHRKAFAIDGGITACLVAGTLTAGLLTGFAAIAVLAVEIAYVVAPNRFAYHTGKVMNPKDPNSTESFYGYNNRLADRVFKKEISPELSTV